MSGGGVFRTNVAGEYNITDPESLFETLTGRDPDIRHLWSHQADILRSYTDDHADETDVAIELPTGTGKTLIGLLIGEFRRRARGERVVYVCPTRQLAYQVSAQAKTYDIAAHALVGKQVEYPESEYAEYAEARALAVTTYSGIFNTNPRLSDAQVLLLDDAHAGDSYVSDMWTIRIHRATYRKLFRSLVDLLADGLPPSFRRAVARADEDDVREGDVELVPGLFVRREISGVEGLLDTLLPDGDSSRYAWEQLQGHIESCCFFASPRCLEIRPFIAPTHTHAAFANPSQRIYMSATLGGGGELERAFGVKRIARLPTPKGWKGRGTGRRLFLIPEIALSLAESMEVAADIMCKADRSLLLAPSRSRAARITAYLVGQGLQALAADDIEESIEPFVSRSGCFLALSRFDGLDLPDEACRVLVMWGTPAGTSHIERFFWSGLGAQSVLRNRILTRVSQGAGRCTRSDSDYATVILMGQDLLDFVLKAENRSLLNPELQAELAFGLENARDISSGQLLEMHRAFLEHGEEWREPERVISTDRERRREMEDPAAERLEAAAGQEIACTNELWRGNYARALELSRAVADLLEGDEVRAYRGWWYYVSADIALLLHDATSDVALLTTARDCLDRASSCCISASWFARAGRMCQLQGQTDDSDELVSRAAETTRRLLAKWGSYGAKFEASGAEVADDLRCPDHKRFHRGLRNLGQMLGFESELPPGAAAPDCIWVLGGWEIVVHEAKSEHSPNDPIGAKDIRQAASHQDWVRTNYPEATTARVTCLVESPRSEVEESALPHVRGLCHVAPSELSGICERAMAVLRSVRARVSDLTEEDTLDLLREEMASAQLTPAEVIQELSQRAVEDLAVRGGG